MNFSNKFVHIFISLSSTSWTKLSEIVPNFTFSAHKIEADLNFWSMIAISPKQSPFEIKSWATALPSSVNSVTNKLPSKTIYKFLGISPWLKIISPDKNQLNYIPLFFTYLINILNIIRNFIKTNNKF